MNKEGLEILQAIEDTNKFIDKYSKISAVLLSIILTGLFIFVLSKFN